MTILNPPATTSGSLQGNFFISRPTGKIKRAIILIDGSNFYFKLRGLGLDGLLNFDFSRFSKKLFLNLSLVQAIYYIGGIKTDGSKRAYQMFVNQRRLLSHLKACGFDYYLGYLLKSGDHYKEKGVDVKIATDLLLGACKNQYDLAFVVSSDSDLIPAIQGAQALRKTIIYVGFKHHPSHALIQACSHTILLNKKDLQELIHPS